MKIDIDSITIHGGLDNLHPIDIKTLPYPGFATDIQQPLTALFNTGTGTVNRYRNDLYRTF